MQVSSFTKYICPLDDLPLFERKHALQCENNHSFDRTKEGYCNLLLVQHKATKDPGDNQQMVAARKSFLNKGYYAPLVKKLFDIVEEFGQKNPCFPNIALVDAACGEGYYLEQIAELARKSKSERCLELAGFDISKSAIRAASKRSRDISWCVASNRKIPYAKASVQILLSLFGFPNWENFSQVQSENGIVILADANTEHLMEMRKVLYEVVKPSSPSSLETALANGYREIKKESQRFSISLASKSDIQELLAMTPHAYRANELGLSKLSEIESMKISVDILIRVMKNSPLNTPRHGNAP